MEATFVEFLVSYGKEGIFLVLFGYLFWDTRNEGKTREKELYDQLDKSNEQLDKCIITLEKLQNNFDSINDKIDSLNKKLEV